MHVVLRPAGEQMFDTGAWRGPAVVGGDKCSSYNDDRFGLEVPRESRLI